MTRGGRRPRKCPGDVPVWVSSDRWGRRRARVTECWAVLCAEHVYTFLLRGPEPVEAGGRGKVTWTPDGWSFTADFEIRANSVWRHGRVFLRCSRCSRLATRLYVPTETAWLACRRCWGLTYQSRTQNNYKDGTACAGLPFSHRSMAQVQTYHERRRRHAACVERWAERRKLLNRTA